MAALLCAPLPKYVSCVCLRVYSRRDRTLCKGAPPGQLSAWQKQAKQRQADDTEARSVTLQPIQDHKAQRIKNKLSHCLNKAVRKGQQQWTCSEFTCRWLKISHHLDRWI